MPHVFISYVREDYERAQTLANNLRGVGIDVWLDRERISPGENWRDAIRNAITNGAFFLACFSTAYVNRQQSYANEELLVAIEKIRTRAWGSKWFLPVLLDACEVPDIAISANLRLRDLQWLSFPAEGWENAVSKLAATINSLNSPLLAEQPLRHKAADTGPTLLEELFLLCVEPGRADQFDGYAFAAATLAELILARRVTLSSSISIIFTATIIDRTPMDDRILDSALNKLSGAATGVGKSRSANIGGYRVLYNLCEYGDHRDLLVETGIIHITKKAAFFRGPTVEVVTIRKQSELQKQFMDRVRGAHIGSERDAFIAAIGSVCAHSSIIPSELWEKAGKLAEKIDGALLIKRLIIHAKDNDFGDDNNSWAGAS